MSTFPVGITGLGSYLPEQLVTNEDFARRLDTSDEWIRTRTGIRERHYAAPDEATSDLALHAAMAALADAGSIANRCEQAWARNTTDASQLCEQAARLAERARAALDVAIDLSRD